MTDTEGLVSAAEAKLRTMAAEEDKDKKWRQHLERGVADIAGRQYIDDAIEANAKAMEKHNADRQAVRLELDELPRSVVSAGAEMAGYKAEVGKLRAVALQKVIDETPSAEKGHLVLKRLVELGGDGMTAFRDENLDVMLSMAEEGLRLDEEEEVKAEN